MYSTPIDSNASVDFRRAFDIIYVEQAAMEHPRTRQILSRLPHSTVIPCRDYKDIFCRRGQEPALQKQAQALILALGKPPYLYPGAPVCQNFGEEHFYYTSGVMNCIFDCEYCYLQGMYTSGHMVVFVNPEDTFRALDEILARESAYVCISYDTDLLALEPLLGFVSEWCAYASAHPNLTLELRTKCAAISTLSSLPVTPNCVLALTLSPDAVIRAYEHRTAPLSARLEFAKTALSLGWPVRLCFDPMLSVPDYTDRYNAMFDTVFAALPMDRIRDVSIGLFRISKDYLKQMRKHRPCAVTYYPYELTDGVYHYPKPVSDALTSLAYQRLTSVLPAERIFLWESDETDIKKGNDL